MIQIVKKLVKIKAFFESGRGNIVFSGMLFWF